MRNWISYASSSNWLRVVGVSTIILLGSYTLVQQSTRLSANDAPLAAAQTAKHQLENGMKAQQVVPATPTNLKTDSTIFITVVDSSRNVLASSAQLDGAPTLPPSGTFDTATKKGSNWFTWEPENGVRLATQVLPYSLGSSSGYVVAGQSLKQAEDRINTYGWIILATWGAVLVWTTFIPVPVRKKRT